MHALFFHQVRSMLAAAVLGLGLLATGSQASGAETTFHWGGNCEDCASAIGAPSYAVTGSLTLLDYELGDPIASDNFVSFSYNGSNLILPFTVGGSVTDRGAGLWGTDTVFSVDGQIDTVPAANRFELLFDDGLFFQTQSDGSWSTCAPDDNVYYGGNSCFSFPAPVPADFGNAASFAAAPVPEPGAWLMLAAGLGVLGIWRRRRPPLAA